MKAIILYDTRFGNTERVANKLAAGLSQTSVETQISRISESLPDVIPQYDLVCIGGPTEGFTATKSVKLYLAKLESMDVSGRYAFAFDTKINSRLAGSAAKYIEKELESLGFNIIFPRESAIVTSIKARGAIVGAQLKEGEEERFRMIGASIGNAIVAKTGVPNP